MFRRFAIFGAQLIVPIYYNLLLYRHECFIGKYAARKIHAKLHVAIEWRIDGEQSFRPEASFEIASRE